jgi:microcompartment protein CcmK/EutM
MYLARVIGHVEARVRLPGFESQRLWLLQPVDFQKQPVRWVVIACDCTGSAAEEAYVTYVEGREAANPFEPAIPVDACITALVDSWEYQGQATKAI